LRTKLAICLILGLILVPATVMAAGSQGQGKIGAQGNAPVLQEQTGEPGAAACQHQFCTRNGFDDSGTSGNGKMLRIRSCTAEGNEVKTMARNQTRLRDGSCGTHPAQ